MITAIDTNVLIDVFTASDRASLEALRIAYREGALVVGEIVYAECCAGADRAEVDAAFREFNVSMIPSGPTALAEAGAIWVRYLKAGGTRKRILPDFLIGAHAAHHADRLLTRDRGFFRKNFRNLELLEP